MAGAGRSPSRTRELLALFGGCALPIPWIVARVCLALDLSPELTATLAGLAILGGAFIVSWSAELAERDLPQSLAILVLALVAVLPEYAVDLHFAWTAGKDPSYAQYAVANMTGANRLLIGLGWAVVVLISCWRTRTTELVIHPRQCLEIRFLLWATLYSFFIPLSGTISLFDAVVLFAIFGYYAFSAMHGGSEEVELVGPPALIDRSCGAVGRRAWAVALFVFAALAIFISAEPFADSLVTIGRSRAIDEFLLVQWVAPLASESPEFLIAILFALRLRGSVGIGALISSKVNQWTLLVGAIPIAYTLSAGSWHGLPLDERQTEELFLTSAQSLLAAIVIVDLRFSRFEAIVLATLFAGQFFVPSTEGRYVFIVFYLAMSVGLLVSGGRERWRLLLLLVLSGPQGERGLHR
jgi:cation:H+ antiporter